MSSVTAGSDRSTAEGEDTALSAGGHTAPKPLLFDGHASSNYNTSDPQAKHINPEIIPTTHKSVPALQSLTLVIAMVSIISLELKTLSTVTAFSNSLTAKSTLSEALAPPFT